MSKEAKVGLLLGLLFIAGIVVVLRGIHPDLAEMMDEELAISEPVRETSSAEEKEGVDFSESVSRLADPWRGPASALAAGHEAVVVEDGAEEWEELRYEQELPGIGGVVLGLEAVEPAEASVVEAPRRSALEQALDDLAERMQDTAAPVVTYEALSSLAGVAANAGVERMPMYTVEKGEDLSRISRRVYGATEGKRWVNVKRIYEANRDQLASMDVVRVGQKLRIPSLEVGLAVAAVEPEVRRPAAGSGLAAGRSYTVKEGDSLWEIAAEQLGSGVRYKEILELNGERLRDENSVLAGMELALPVR